MLPARHKKAVLATVALLPKSSHPFSSSSAPIITCNWECGKMSLIHLFWNQFKVIPVCTAVGSGYWIIPMSDITSYIVQKESTGADPMMSLYYYHSGRHTAHNVEHISRGPRIKMPMTTVDGIKQCIQWLTWIFLIFFLDNWMPFVVRLTARLHS